MEPDGALRERLVLEADKMGLQVRGGLHWSTDGFFRETAGIVARHRQAGASAVDMETAGLWAAARYRGVKLVSLMVVSDLLGDGEHHLGFELPEFRLALRQAAELAWRALGLAA
jgi:purine-nucleoside phosphorylase